MDNDLRELGVRLFIVEPGQLKLVGPRSAITPILIEQIKKYKKDLLGYLARKSANGNLPVQSNVPIAVYKAVVNGKAVIMIDSSGRFQHQVEKGIRERFSHYHIENLYLVNSPSGREGEI